MTPLYIACPKCDCENPECDKCDGEGVLNFHILDVSFKGHPSEKKLNEYRDDYVRCEKQLTELCKLKPEHKARYREMFDETVDKLNQKAHRLYEFALE